MNQRRALQTGTVLALVPVVVMGEAAPVAADLPGAGIIEGAVDSVVSSAFEGVADGIAGWVLGAVGDFVGGVVEFITTSVSPDVEAAWFSGAGSPYATVRAVAAVLLAGFVLLALLQGLLRGDTAAMARSLVRDLPLAVLGTVATTAVVAKLLELTDALSTTVLASGGGAAVSFLSGFGSAATAATSGFAAVLLGLVAVVAGALLWAELLVRSALVYLLAALSPLAYAAAVWPAARGALRRSIELTLAVIVSKLVICTAVALGAAALGGAGTAAPPGVGLVEEAATSTGALLAGTVVLALAAFSPFLVLRLVPVAEAAVLAQGTARSPLRAATMAIGTTLSVASLGRLAGGGAGGKSAPALAAGTSGQGTAAAGGASSFAASGSRPPASAGNGDRAPTAEPTAAGPPRPTRPSFDTRPTGPSAGGAPPRPREPKAGANE